jgi:hypothetical protein
VLDGVGVGVVREARIGEGRPGAVERGEGGLRGGEQSIALAEAGREVVHEPAGALGPHDDLRRSLDRRREVVDGERAGVPRRVGHVGEERLHEQRGDVPAVGAALDPPAGVDAGVVGTVPERDDRGVGVEARRHAGGQ